MSTPLSGGGASVGTATGKVRIEYESVGASRVVSEVNAVERAIQQSAGHMTRHGQAASSNALGLTQLHNVMNQLHQQNTRLNQLNGGSGNTNQSHHAQMQNLMNHMQNQMGTMTFAPRVDLAQTRIEAQHARRIIENELRGIRFTPSAGGGGHNSPSGSGSQAGSDFATGFKQGVGSGLVNFGLSGLTSAASAAVNAMGYTLTKGFSRLETIDTAATKMRALGYTTAQTKQIMQSALESVDKTAFSLDQAASTAVDALAAGVDPGGLTDYLKTIANTASLAKVGMADMGLTFNQVATQGKLMGDQLASLQGGGIPALKYLAEEFGVTQAKAQDMVSNGEVSFERFNHAMQTHTKGIALTMGQSIGGSIDNVKTAIGRLGAAFLAPLFGTADGQMSTFARSMQVVQQKIDELAKFLKMHQPQVIAFWELNGHLAIAAGQGVTIAVAVIVKAVAGLMEAMSAAMVPAANVFEFFGADGIGANLRRTSDQLDKGSQSLYKLGDGAFNANDTLGGLHDKLDQWAKDALAGLKPTDDLGNAFTTAAPKVITLKDALDKLGLKQDSATTGLTGTVAQFKELMQTLATKNAPKEMVDTVTRLRVEFENGGRTSKNFADAIDKLGDNSATAEDKANGLLKALQDMGSLPGGDALKSFNDSIREATDYNAKLADVMDTTGAQLINMNGTINTSSKNGSTLAGTIGDIRQKMYALAASGDGNPAEIWERTDQALVDVLGQFGIFGDKAQQIINKYLLPEKNFEILFNTKNEPEVQKELTALLQMMDDAKAKGTNQVQFQVGVDPGYAKQFQETIESLGGKWDQYSDLTHTATVTIPQDSELSRKRDQIKNILGGGDPTKLDSELNISTTSQDIVRKITGGDNVLRIPAILDFKLDAGGNVANKWTGGVGNFISGGGFDQLRAANQGPQYRNLPPVNLPPGVTLPPANSPPALTPSNKIPLGTSLLPMPGDAPFPGNVNQSGLTNLANNPQLLNKLYEMHPDVANTLKPFVLQAQNQGKNLASAFSEGMDSANPQVRDAIIRLAELAGTGLGQSPAKYGPLSGQGWTYFRGQNFTTAWASGMASQSSSIATAAGTLAQAAVNPLDDQIKGWVKDMTELNSFAQHFSSLATQVGQIGVGFARAADLMGGRGSLFPPSYRINPAFDPRRNRMPAWAPGGAGLPPGLGGGAPGPLAAGAGKQDIANYIMNKALSEGYSRTQAEQILTQAVGESGLGAGASGGGGAWKGIFQETPEFFGRGGRTGDVNDPQSNIDAYFAQMMRDGGPQAFTDPAAFLGRKVSVGGPWHPDNAAKGDLAAAQAAARQYIAGFQAMPQGLSAGGVAFNPGAGGGAGVGMPGAGTNYNPDWMVQHGFPALFHKAGGDATQAEIPGWLHAIAGKFGLPISSHADQTLHGGTKGGGNQLDPSGSWAVDIGGPGSDPGQMEALAQYLETNFMGDIAQLIHRSATTDYGIAGGANVGGARGKGSYYTTGQGYNVHGDHVHVAFARAIAALSDQISGVDGQLPIRANLVGFGAPAPLSPGDIPPPIPGFPGFPGVPQVPSDIPIQPVPNPSDGLPPILPPSDGPPPLITPPGQLPTGAAGFQPWTMGKEGWKYRIDNKGETWWLPPGLTEPKINSDGSMGATPNGVETKRTAKGWQYFPAGTKDKNIPTPETKVAPVQANTNQPGATAPGPKPTTTTPSLPGSQFDGGLPQILAGGDGAYADLIAQNPSIAAAIMGGQGLGGSVQSWQQAVPLLQDLDRRIAQQQNIINNAPPGAFSPEAQAAQAQITRLNSAKSNLQGQFGLQEGPSALDSADMFMSGASGVASDFFQTIDASLKAIESTQNIGDQLVRGVSNTDDVMKMVDDFQSFITLASRIFQTAGDVTQMAGSFSGGMDMGGMSGAGSMLSMVGQALQAVNMGIDLAQEGYDIVTKYGGRLLTSWLGLPGAQDMNFLLDEQTGQLQAYTSQNPQLKSSLNTLGRQANPSGYIDQRRMPINYLTLYQGPGEEPRDMMNNMMFAVKSSGIGSFGYDGAGASNGP